MNPTLPAHAFLLTLATTAAAQTPSVFMDAHSNVGLYVKRPNLATELFGP